ncbi:MAG TPA: FtsX-like permease family protein [Symbiobacteriaceae bacterium]|jgi:hypothetical protein
MPPELVRLTAWDLLWAELRRSPRRSLAGLAVALVATIAVFGTTWTLAGMKAVLASDMQRMGADIVLAPRGYQDAVGRLLTAGTAPAIPTTIPVAEWRSHLTPEWVYGIVGFQGWSLERGGAGKLSGPSASIVLVRLDQYASPMITRQMLVTALPDAEVVVAEQSTRQVTRHLQLLVRLLGTGAGVGLLGAVLMSGLLASITVAERRAELGMLRTMGATQWFLMSLVLAESGVPALAGGVVGALATAAAFVFRDGTGQLRRLTLYGIGSVVGVCAAVVVTALLPALRAAWMDPLEATRR